MLLPSHPIDRFMTAAVISVLLLVTHAATAVFAVTVEAGPKDHVFLATKPGLAGRAPAAVLMP